MLLVNESQAFVAQISDPFAIGWNIFGTAGYSTNIALIGAKRVVHATLDDHHRHIIATYIAHRIALREFDSRTKVIVGQIPVLLLMVFTQFSGFGSCRRISKRI